MEESVTLSKIDAENLYLFAGLMYGMATGTASPEVVGYTLRLAQLDVETIRATVDRLGDQIGAREVPIEEANKMLSKYGLTLFEKGDSLSAGRDI